jgi:hypothetical protein
MIDAMTITNSAKPIGRWLEETQASALMSVTWHLLEKTCCIDNAALHNPLWGMAAPSKRLESQRKTDPDGRSRGLGGAKLPRFRTGGFDGGGWILRS